jgi:hypothetical protein
MSKALALLSVVSLAVASPAAAQIYEAVGIRAQGMGGAFVAIADDADANWWNPAGLAGGAYFSSIIEYGTLQQPGQELDAAGAPLPAWRSGARGFTAMFPSLGVSYYRLQVSQIRPFGATADALPGREDRGRAPVFLSSLLLQQFGATVGQSVGQHLVVATTVRVARGRFASESAAADVSFDAAEALDGHAETHMDLDVGAIVRFGGVRIGAAMKHVTEPSFSSGDDRVDLVRQARAGIAATLPGAGGALTVAVDADLTRTPTAMGDVRHVAAGAEAWLLPRRLALRGGITANTVGDARLSGSAGVSVALRTGLYVDGQTTGWSDETTKGWGLALRATF